MAAAVDFPDLSPRDGTAVQVMRISQRQLDYLADRLAFRMRRYRDLSAIYSQGTVQSRLVAVGATVTIIVAENRFRRTLMLGMMTGNAVALNVNATVIANQGLPLTTSLPLYLTRELDGPVVCSQWQGITSAGTTQVRVIEVIVSDPELEGVLQ